MDFSCNMENYYFGSLKLSLPDIKLNSSFAKNVANHILHPTFTCLNFFIKSRLSVCCGFLHSTLYCSCNEIYSLFSSNFGRSSIILVRSKMQIVRSGRYVRSVNILIDAQCLVSTKCLSTEKVYHVLKVYHFLKV